MDDIEADDSESGHHRLRRRRRRATCRPRPGQLPRRLRERRALACVPRRRSRSCDARTGPALRLRRRQPASAPRSNRDPRQRDRRGLQRRPWRHTRSRSGRIRPTAGCGLRRRQRGDSPRDRGDPRQPRRRVPVAVGISYDWRYEGSRAWPRRLVLTKVAKGATVKATCKGPRGACFVTTHTLKGTSQDLDLRKLLFKVSKQQPRAALMSVTLAACRRDSVTYRSSQTGPTYHDVRPPCR
jgi:hypothetical protein